MPSGVSMPDFDDLADVYWRLGVMQSPAQLQGHLVGQLAVGAAIAADPWLQQAAGYIDAVQPPETKDNQLLLALYTATSLQLSGGEMNLQLLLPDDAVEITQRVESIAQWCQGFMAGFAMVAKVVQQQQGQQQYSQDVSEALSDMAAISQISLADDDGDREQRERNFFEVSEYLRLAAITIYLECHQPAQSGNALLALDTEEVALSSPQNLFNKTGKKLH
ncbi:MAG: UPF0149 family protein [Pseudomonadales bacterium]